MSVYENLDLNDREYLQRTLERVREGLSETLALLTGKDYVLGEPGFDIDDVNSLSDVFPGKSVVARGRFSAGLEGNYTIVFSGNDVITATSLLGGDSEDEAAHRMEQGITEQALKAFEEVARQIFDNIGVFLTRLFDAKMSLELRALDAVSIAANAESFAENTGFDASVVVLYRPEQMGSLMMLIPLGVAKELSAIGLPGLPKRSPAPRGEKRATSDSLKNIGRLLRIEMPIIVKLAEKVESLEKVLNYSEGHIIEFDKSSDEPLDLMIVDKLVGHGQAVKIGENFGIRIHEIGSPRETLRKLR
ncbi:MAG: FliM/FliN family flagellar motor switch protein [Planctomycetota bacterium]|jgi:flagellar motor switch protein FliN/FliY